MVKRKPIILISNDANIYLDETSVPRIISCPASYAEAVAESGGIPILTCEQCPEEIERMVDGIILTGGKDIEPNLYNEQVLNDSVKLDPIRSKFEVPLARAFLHSEKPILAICRGCQLINVLLGGTLYQDLPTQKGLFHLERNIRHMVFAREDSVLNKLYGPSFYVNSTHHQAICNLASGLKMTAISSDGVIEAFEHEILKIIGCQFHPERLVNLTDDERTPNFITLFKYFVDTVARTITS